MVAYGIRVSKRDRDALFNQSWNEIAILAPTDTGLHSLLSIPKISNFGSDHLAETSRLFAFLSTWLLQLLLGFQSGECRGLEKSEISVS